MALAKSERSDDERQIQMNKVNPAFVLRNYLLEQAIRQANNKDFSEVEKLLK